MIAVAVHYTAAITTTRNAHAFSGRLGADAWCERGRRRGDGFLAHAGILYIAFGLGPAEAHDKDYGEADQGDQQQTAHHTSQATVAE